MKKRTIVKPDKGTLLFLIISVSFALFNIAALVVGLIVWTAQNTTMLYLPSYFKSLCLAVAVVDGVWLLGCVGYFLYKKL